MQRITRSLRSTDKVVIRLPELELVPIPTCITNKYELGAGVIRNFIVTDIDSVYDYIHPRVWPNSSLLFKNARCYYHDDPDNEPVAQKMGSLPYFRGNLDFLERCMVDPPQDETKSPLPILSWSECNSIMTKENNMSLHEQSRVLESIVTLLNSNKETLYSVDFTSFSWSRLDSPQVMTTLTLLSLFTEKPGYRLLAQLHNKQERMEKTYPFLQGPFESSTILRPKTHFHGRMAYYRKDRLKDSGR
ncbi:hypothetical protein BDK51DRAFT_32142 [Blyttiomyces helicus]|uniref:Uncharacterized protein n=1 Tax=Blyttiomyces helicus TaxID=388810 RepID=A0A4P9W684_9FUNG|nr:hypothetical protein BDK51DRAFT_32142 [Blyttiomyces helicus]|eukprot:RKO87961.1 hypothetical protein BDK51DRAFT_32142 [Blyttiomyces helicus]